MFDKNIINREQGRLFITIGCMFSGKSTEMIRMINRYRNLKNLNILIINHIEDKRYGENVISSHDKLQINCISLCKLNEIKNTEDYKKVDVIFIEEAQFFEDLYDFTLYSLDKLRKYIYIYGLNGDYLRNPFGDIFKLIPHCDGDIKKLNALCLKCNDGTEANFTKRIVENTNVKLIGNQNSYIPVCRFHYLNN